MSEKMQQNMGNIRLVLTTPIKVLNYWFYRTLKRWKFYCINSVCFSMLESTTPEIPKWTLTSQHLEKGSFAQAIVSSPPLLHYQLFRQFRPISQSGKSLYYSINLFRRQFLDWSDTSNDFWTSQTFSWLWRLTFCGQLN